MPISHVPAIRHLMKATSLCTFYNLVQKNIVLLVCTGVPCLLPSTGVLLAREGEGQLLCEAGVRRSK